MFIDFKILNKQIKINIYPISQIDQILDCLCKAQVFSKIDLSKVYYQVAVEPSHMHKTTFLMKYRLFNFVVLLFGLVNAPENSNGWSIPFFKRPSNISCWFTLMAY